MRVLFARKCEQRVVFYRWLWARLGLEAAQETGVAAFKKRKNRAFFCADLKLLLFFVVVFFD